jgi:hypothetical protein
MHFAMHRLSNEEVVSQLSGIKTFPLFDLLFIPSNIFITVIDPSFQSFHSFEKNSLQARFFNGAGQFDGCVSKFFFRFNVFFLQPVFEVAEWKKSEDVRSSPFEERHNLVIAQD